ncbi:MAG: hypothetical protein AVDCRST_MAG56-4454 [uncultured Cytophagales bacterium]|uniref:Secretion system C-terminal sorting domain-containing protein n=1 Tax=uncultured Cytophagales bacterium TaxID=158755 RepID=A0A6J4JX34_9SPHI|nr:MAG: hypothetical protein AVDCRST_MAG56-4454 [uncultured Cytophagales bacterium]
MTDITGKVVKVLTSNLEHPAGSFIKEVDVSQMAAGTYLYTLQTGKNKFTKRLVVTK